MRRRMLLALKIAELGLLAAPSCAAPATILDRPDVRAAIATMRKESFGTRELRIEYVLIVRTPNSPYPLDWIAGSREDATFPWDNQIIAIIHTHLDKGFEKPSATDITEAKAHHTPIYVVSASAIWVATAIGETACISCPTVRQ